MDTLPVAVPGRRRRRRHSAEFKASAIESCRQPGVSVASVALANGLNANLLRKWVIEAERTGGIDSRELSIPRPPETRADFIPLELPGSAPAADIHVELQRGGTKVNVTWPSSAAAQCAMWLRELLK